MTWHTMDTMPERGEQVLLWRGLTDDDGGFPAIARAVSYKGGIFIRYKSEGEDWQELTRDEYPDSMWARIPKPGDEDDAVPILALARWLAGYSFPPDEIAAERWEEFLRGMDWAQPDLRDGWTEEHHERDCRDCVEWETCPVGKGAHERGASIGYSAGECPDFMRLTVADEK